MPAAEIRMLVTPEEEGWQIEIIELDGSEFAKVWGSKWTAWEQAQKYAEDLYASIE